MDSTRPQQSANVLDSIDEKTSNVERIGVQNLIERTIANTLRLCSHKERLERESTITFSKGTATEDGLTNLSRIIDTEWVKARGQLPVIYWQDKESHYAQFISETAKMQFLRFIDEKKVSDPGNFLPAELMLKVNNEGYHLTRKPVNLLLSGVRGNVQAKIIETMLSKYSSSGAIYSCVREGRPYGDNKLVRCFMLKVNAEAFRIIFDQFHALLPYWDEATGMKAKLYPKVNCKPWSCNSCYFIGPNHRCGGKICATCASREHSAKDCKSKTRFCSNCKKGGHRAKDAHCPVYMKEVSRILRKMDIPLEFFEDRDKRFMLIKYLHYK